MLVLGPIAEDCFARTKLCSLLPDSLDAELSPKAKTKRYWQGPNSHGSRKLGREELRHTVVTTMSLRDHWQLAMSPLSCRFTSCKGQSRQEMISAKRNRGIKGYIKRNRLF